jgi:hypothetical protein
VNSECCMQCQCDRCLNAPSPVDEPRPIEVGRRALKRRGIQLRRKAHRLLSEAILAYREASAADGKAAHNRDRVRAERLLAASSENGDAVE